MANPWDKDEVVAAPAAGNPWDADVVVKPANKKQATPMPAQQEPTSFLGGIGNAIYGAAKGAADAVQGPGQLLLHMGQYFGGNREAGDRKRAEKEGRVYGDRPEEKEAIARGARYDEMVKNFDSHLADQERRYQNDTPGSWAAGTGRVGAAVAPFLASGGATGASQAAARAPGLANALRATGTAATQGAGIGALTPVTDVASAPTLESLISGKSEGDNFWQQKGLQAGIGAVTGGTMNRVGAGVGSLYNALRPVLSPKSTVGNQILSGVNQSVANAAEEGASGGGSPSGLPNLINDMDPQAVIVRLNSAGPIIPGSQPTTAQVAGIPQLVMAEKALKNNPAYREAFENRTVANNAARMAALRSVAKTPEELAAALKARSDKAGELYNQFDQRVIPLDPTLEGILNTPIGRDAVSRARALAANSQQPFGMKPGVPEQIVPSSLLDAAGRPLSQTTIPAVPGELSGKAANQIKMSIDAMKRDVPTAGIASHEAGALEGVRSQLVNHLDTSEPLFKEARQAYAQGSQPVNSMQAGQSILNGLSGLGHNVSNDVAPMLSQYRTQLAKALKNSKYGMEPEAQKTLENIQQDMQREAISNSIRSAGSDTAFNMQAPNWLSGKLLGQGMDGKSTGGRALGALGGFLTGGPMGAVGGHVVAEKAGSFVGNRVNSEFQKAMLDPQYFAKLLAEALERQKSASAPLQQYAPAGARAASMGADSLTSQ